MNFDHTICAISTAPGIGGIAVVRVSGKDCFQITNKLVKKSILSQAANTSIFNVIMDGDSELDEVVITKFIGPKSFTGDDVIEINCHGSIFIQNRLLELLTENGAVMAEPGEFTMRAYLNGKMDLTQAEAVADIIESEHAASHRMAMHQMKGGFSKDLITLRQQLIDFASLIELELDFSEEDVEFADRSQLNELIDRILTFISGLIDSFQMGNAIKNGISVAIIGIPNAGKSTLMNTLLNEERAIVSEIPGTTRDTIEEALVINGVKFRLVDTAGIRASEDKIETIGVERSFESASKASIIINLFDSAEKENYDALLAKIDLQNKAVIHVANKTDLHTVETKDVIAISALHKTGIDKLIDAIYKAAQIDSIQSGQSVVSNQRHLEALKNALQDLDKVKFGLQNGTTGDFIAMDIRSALRHLGSITGEVSTDDLLGNIFGKFCIGK